MHGSVEFMVRRSPSFAALVVVIHLFSLALVWAFSLPIALHLALKLAILASLLVSLRSLGWLGARTYPLRLRLAPAASPAQSNEPDQVEIRLASGRVIQGEIADGSLVLAWAVILRCRPLDARWWRPAGSWLILPDCLPQDDFRRIRVRLRWGRSAPV